LFLDTGALNLTSPPISVALLASIFTRFGRWTRQENEEREIASVAGPTGDGDGDGDGWTEGWTGKRLEPEQGAGKAEELLL